MDYDKIYKNLIDSRIDRKKETGLEKHHIIPKCLGGNDKPNNLVYLTLKEHFIAHLLLCEIYPNQQGLWYSIWMMSNRCKKNKNSRFYQNIREKYIENRKNMKVSNETKHKMSESRKGKIPWNKGMKNPYSPDVITNLKLYNKGKTYDDIYGKERSEIIRKKLSDIRKGKPGLTKGYKMSLESNKKRSESHKKIIKNDVWLQKISNSKKIPILQYSLDGKLINEWGSSKEASEILKISKSGISQALKQKIKTYKKSIWKYK